MYIGLLKQEAEEQYRNFIDDHPNASIYHTLDWRSIIQKTYSYQPCYIIAKDGEEIKGVLPLFEVKSAIHGKRLVSIPFSHWVSILCQDLNILYQMVDFAKHLTQKKKCSYLEIKHGSQLPANIGLIRREHFFHSILNLSIPINDIYDKFKKDIRQGIRKAKNSPLKLIIGEKLEHYRAFYRLELETRKRQGSPPYSSVFFETLFSSLYLPGKVKLYLALAKRQYIAGVIMLFHNQIAITGYSASTSNREFMKLKPNNLLFWQAIKDAHQCGYEYFSRGITDPSNEGLLRFKSAWGTINTRIPYYYFLNTASDVPIINRSSLKLRIATDILKRMPLPLLRNVGPLLLKQLG